MQRYLRTRFFRYGEAASTDARRPGTREIPLAPSTRGALVKEVVMSTTTEYKDLPVTAPAGNGKVAPAPEAPELKGHGWMVFATAMLIFAGTLGLIDGIVALSKSSFYVANAQFVFSDLRTWGWIVAIVGGLTLLAGLSVMSGSELARWFGMSVAGLQAIAQLMMIQAYPWWSVAVFAVDVLVIYALAVYGGSRLRRAA